MQKTKHLECTLFHYQETHFTSANTAGCEHLFPNTTLRANSLINIINEGLKRTPPYGSLHPVLVAHKHNSCQNAIVVGWVM